MTLRIAIRADASPEIGSGHLMRCLTLADEMAGRGAEVTFVTRAAGGPLLETVRAKGHDVRVLEDDGGIRPAGSHPGPGTAHAHWLPVSMAHDAEQTAEVLAQLGGVDWLVADHYALDHRWETSQRAHARKILVIDDLADRRHDCDVLLDQNLVEGLETRYDGLVPTGCRKLLGPTYALLRPEFREARRTLPERDGTVRRILVAFGGADPTNETEKALDAIGLLGRPEIVVDVVLGAMCPHIEAVRAQVAAMQAAGHGEVRLHVQVGNMTELMADADLAIGAMGSTTWERCCLGLPAIAYAVAANQVRSLAKLGSLPALIELGVAKDASANDINVSLALLTRVRSLLQALSATAAQICDGRGTGRVIDALGIDGDVRLRRATEADARRLLEWRNHASARAVSLTKHEISWDEHTTWLSRALIDSNQSVLIAERGGHDIGVVRFANNGDAARVSITIAPELQGTGNGVRVLRAGEDWVRRHHPGVRRLEAEIVPGNTASQRVFAAAGYCYDRLIYTRVLGT